MEAYVLAAEIMREQSRRLDPEEIKQFINFIESVIPKKLNLLYSKSMFNLNKEFQCGVAGLKEAIELIFAMEEAILSKEKPFTLRYIITFGEIEVPRRKHMFYGIVGHGISRAEARMDRLRLKPSHRFYVDTLERTESEYFTRLLLFYQFIWDSWTPKESKMVSQFLNFWDYKEIADHLGQTRSATWKRRKSLHIDAYENIKDLLLRTPEMIIKKKKSRSNEQPPAF